MAVTAVELWKALSYLGTEAFYVLLCTLLYTAWSPRRGIVLLASTALGAALTLYLKAVLHLPRPPPSEWLVPAYGYGFPSGHALVSSSFWTSLTLVSGCRALAALAAAVVIAVSVSRVELHVHYVRDVVGGALIGFAVGFTLYRLSRRALRETILCTSIIATALSLTALLAPAPGLSPESIAVATRYCYTVAGISIALAVYPLVERRVRDEVYRSISAVKRLGLAIAIAIAATVSAVASTKLIAYPQLLLPSFAAITLGVLSSPLALASRR